MDPNLQIPNATTAMAGALQGLRVLDLTHVLAGPFCTYQMAVLGACVTKIEAPQDPDCARGRGPDEDANARGMGLNYQVQGGNKRSLGLNLATPEGRQILMALVRDADVLVQNYRSGALDRLGLDAQSLMACNPRLIHCSLTGFGDVGPMAGLGAYDNVIQAESGIIAQCGGVKPAVSFVDYATGYAAAYAVMAALVQRGVTGQGCAISVSMQEVAMQMMAPEVAAAQRGAVPRPKEAGIDAYDTAEGQLMLGAFKPAQYRRLGEGLAALGHDLPLLATIRDWPDVWRNADALRAGLARIFARRTADEWAGLLHEMGLPAARLRSLQQAVRSPQLAARGYFASPAGVSLPVAAFRMSQGGPALDRAPPALGADTDAILRDLGHDPRQIAEWRASGVVA